MQTGDSVIYTGPVKQMKQSIGRVVCMLEDGLVVVKYRHMGRDRQSIFHTYHWEPYYAETTDDVHNPDHPNPQGEKS